jgi:prephenate dehydratase
MRLGYFGPAGTFTEEAARASGPAGELVPFPTIYDTVMAVRDGDVDRAMVPIENSLEGGVNATLDALAVETDAVGVVGETVLPVRHVLVAGRALELAQVETVVSHPQALAQCARFLREHLPQAQVQAATSTAEAVRSVAGSGRPVAAIGTRLAAELYGAHVLREGVEDDHGNRTRFVWVARAGEPALDPEPADAASWKTSLVFWGPGDASPGWLVRCLSEFAFRGVNLTKIESRPQKKQLGHYLFLVDLQGRDTDLQVADAIDALGRHCDVVRMLGSYPAA